MKQVLLDRMHALLNTICSVVVLYYIALALFFIFIGQAASSKSMLALVGVVWNNFYFYFTKGMFIAPVLWVCLVVMGIVPSLQRMGSVCLSLLAVSSLAVIITMSSSRMEFGELIFLTPCMAVAATSIWLVFRAGTGA